MDLTTRVDGMPTERMASGKCDMLMATHTRASGVLTRNMDRVLIFTQMAQSTSGSGRRTCKAVLGLKSGWTPQIMTGSTPVGTSTVLESMLGPVALITRASSLTTRFKARASTCGLEVASTTANGKTRKWMEKASSLIQMGAGTK